MKFTNSSLVADALSLGPHWVYNQGKLARLYADGIFNYTDPASSFHPHRKAGEFTHYGDQTVMLAESIKAQGSFSIDTWRADWLKNMKAYDGYLDGASKQTLESKGAAPSDSNDLAGASRIGPILDLQLPLEAAISAAREQTALTHGDAGVIDAAEFFVRAVDALQSGADMAAALQKAATEGNYTELDAEHSLKKAVIAETDDFLKVSREMGLTCHLPEAFPLTLYFALRPDVTAQQTLSDNGVAGGDTSARAMLLAILFAARDGDISELYPAPSALETVEVNPGSNAVGIATPKGRLAGILEMPPSGETLAFALFAHCFTCGKDFVPEKRITQNLAKEGIATLRIDFAGLGKSEGAFEDSSFVTNLEDLELAAGWLKKHFQAPQLLIGHSLGGTAVLSAASRIEGVKAVATIGAPADPGHVTHMFEEHIGTIETEGAAEVQLAGRPFVIGKRFLDDVESYCQECVLKELRGIDFLIMHSPKDRTVSIDNAGDIYTTLFHPKSFISLADADHLLTRREDAEYVAKVIATWASRALS